MELYDLIAKASESPHRSQGRQREVAVALALNFGSINYNNLQIERAYSHKGILTIEVSRDPASEAEFESWKSLADYLSTSWNAVTGYEHNVSIAAPSKWINI
jgi:hypothetical protein